MAIEHCENGCCTLEIEEYTDAPFFYSGRRRRKAGVFIYDPETDRVLLVQSRGQLWGLPKGTIEVGESDRKCAVREVKEETGLDIDDDDFTRAAQFYNRGIYYYMERPFCEVHVQKNVRFNDANGIGWIKVNCLKQLITNGNITLNKHTRLVFRKFMNIDIPETEFVLVKHKKKQ